MAKAKIAFRDKPERQTRAALHRHLKLSTDRASVFQERGEGDVLWLAFELGHVGAGDVHALGHGLLGESGFLAELAQLFAEAEFGQIVLDHFFELWALGDEFAFELSEGFHASCLSADSSRLFALRRS